MNYLAHFFLGFDDPDTVAGQYLADSYKGNRYRKLPGPIARGVILHRHIDSFTDTHEGLGLLRSELRHAAGKWSGPALDVLCDHMLTLQWESLGDGKVLDTFIERNYEILSQYRHLCSERGRYMLDAMRRHNWLNMYRTPAGMQQIFEGMSRRLAEADGLKLVMKVFEQSENQFIEVFNAFFPELVSSCKQKFQSIEYL
jgi:acyl carrier protein phosphodiesterase